MTWLFFWCYSISDISKDYGPASHYALKKEIKLDAIIAN